MRWWAVVEVAMTAVYHEGGSDYPFVDDDYVGCGDGERRTLLGEGELVIAAAGSVEGKSLVVVMRWCCLSLSLEDCSKWI